MDIPVTPAEKERQWQRMAERYAQITDKLGKGIDAGIMETVIVLNLLGMPTRQSCEGHLEHGTCAPWIDVYAPGLDEEEQRFHAMMKHAQQQREQHLSSKEELQRLFAAAHQVRKEIKQQHSKVSQKAMAYLEAFYRTRAVPYDQQLVLRGFWLGSSRIESLGADFQEIVPLDLRQQKLQAYQQEMSAFTDFLKACWLAGTGPDDSTVPEQAGSDG